MGNIEIFYRDDDLAVCVKPQGALSQDAGAQSVPGLLREALGAATIYPVHRLDQAAGGVMVYALTERAAAALSRAVQNGQLEKTYLAVTQGTPQEPEGAWTDLLFHDQRRNKDLCGDAAAQGRAGGAAQLSGAGRRRDAEPGGSAALYRTHPSDSGAVCQPRPALGGRRALRRRQAERLGLWSWRLRFPHPKTGKIMTFCCLPPAVSPWEGLVSEEITSNLNEIG